MGEHFESERPPVFLDQQADLIGPSDGGSDTPLRTKGRFGRGAGTPDDLIGEAAHPAPEVIHYGTSLIQDRVLSGADGSVSQSNGRLGDFAELDFEPDLRSNIMFDKHRQAPSDD